MRRAMLTLLVCLGSACGRLDQPAQPAPSTGAAARPDGGVPLPDSPLPPPPVFPATPDKPISLDLKIARDSAADMAALDSLEKAKPKDELPEFALDAAPSWDLNVATFADQPRVRYYIDFFSGRAHDRFQIWLGRMPRYEEFIRARLAKEGLPEDLVYLALIESGFSTQAVSRAAAVGMWQFMPATGRGYGLRIDAWVDERRDPIKATDAAARHLRDLTQRFGSHYLAAAAYNAGAGKVGRSLTRMSADADDDEEPLDLTSDDAFFSLADTPLLVQETKDYVPKLIAAALIAKEPTKYGFATPEPIAAITRDSVIVEGGTGLDLIARLADTTLDALRELNPHLLRLVTPPGAKYAVRVPAGRAETIAQAYQSTPSDERLAIATHTVRSGETVATLAKKYGVSSEAIRVANRSARGKRLPVGTTLYVPLSTALPVSLLREPEPIANTRTVSRSHVVKRGETLSSIAKKYRVSVASLRSANRIGAKGGVRVGQKLTIRRTTTVLASTRGKATAAKGKGTGKGAKTAVAKGGAAAKTHVVKNGETLGGIAARYGVKVSALASANGLGKRGSIKAGQRLKIPHV